MIDLTPDQFRTIFPHCRDVRFWLKELAALDRWEVTTHPRQAAFLAQVGHESAQFTRLVENLSYSLRGLRVTWPSRFKSDEMALPYTRNPSKLANFVYGGRLGNGPPESGDGYKYRGRGLIQITGKANYEAAGAALNLPLVQHPAMLENPTHAVSAAGWFWKDRGLNELADANTDEAFETITKRINGGMIGHEERRILWRRAREILT